MTLVRDATIPPLVFTVPGKPQPKQRARKGKGGHWYTPTPTRDYEASVRAYAGAALWAGKGCNARRARQWPSDRVYEIVVRAFMPTARKADGDNVLKSVCDGLNKTSVWADDMQAVRHVVETAVDRAAPRTEVEVYVLTEVEA